MGKAPFQRSQPSLARRQAPILLPALAALAVAAVLPLLTGEANINVLTVAIIDMVAIIGVGTLYQYTGLITIGQSAVQAVGAYACAIAIKSLGVPIIPAILVGGVIAGAIGLIIAVASVRLTGIYFAVLTLGLSEFVAAMILILPGLTGGSGGISGPSFQFGSLASYESTYWLALIVLALVFGISYALKSTIFSRALLLAKGRPTAAKAAGINVVKLRIILATICNTLAGISGGLLLLNTSFVSPDSFTFSQSILFLAGAVIGGAFSLWGAIFGGLIIELVPYALASSAEMSVLVLGGGMTLMLILFPRGIADLFGKAARRWLGSHPVSDARPSRMLGTLTWPSLWARRRDSR